MHKVYRYGVHGILHKLIKSHLINRTQQPKVTHIANNHLKEYLSRSLPVRYGVSQDSFLGPLLFISYVNDVPYQMQGRTIMYTDDTSVLNIGQGTIELQIIFFFFFNPLLFASCTNTFSKCCEITTTTDMKRSAQ
jgi:hypothetical protein